MKCSYCTNEAIGKCVGCGAPMCRDHGSEYCQHCSGAVYSRDAEPTVGLGKGYLQSPSKPRMETIYIDDDGPPSCYRCQGLAKKICQNCHQLYCLEHAGSADWCDQCAKSSRVGTWLTLGILVAAAALTVVFFLINKLNSTP
jgi:hypothetical protein